MIAQAADGRGTMSVLDQERVERPSEPEALLPEARQVQRRRYTRTVAVVVVAVTLTTGLLVGLVLSTGHPDRTASGSGSPAVAAVPIADQVTMRPVLCSAPPFVPSGPVATATYPATCGARYLLNKSNLHVTPSSNPQGGYVMKNVAADPSLRVTRTTINSQVVPRRIVLLNGYDGLRYMLGPVSLRFAPKAIVERASAVHAPTGAWVVHLILTKAGVIAFNDVTSKSFHELIGLVLEDKVISTTLIQPDESVFTGFDRQIQIAGNFQIAGSFSQAQAQSIAAAF